MPQFRVARFCVLHQGAQPCFRNRVGWVFILPSSPFLTLTPFLSLSRDPPLEPSQEVWDSAEPGRQTVSVHSGVQKQLKCRCREFLKAINYISFAVQKAITSHNVDENYFNLAFWCVQTRDTHSDGVYTVNKRSNCRVMPTKCQYWKSCAEKRKK